MLLGGLGLGAKLFAVRSLCILIVDCSIVGSRKEVMPSCDGADKREFCQALSALAAPIYYLYLMGK